MTRPLLSIDEARAIVLGATAVLPQEDVEVGEGLGRELAQDVVAGHDVPPFASSAMDGFALVPGPAGRTLRIVGESRAGTPWTGTVSAGDALRISTGAAVPAGLSVLQLELATDHGDEVTAGDDVAAGRNVRGSGEDLRSGAVVLQDRKSVV